MNIMVNHKPCGYAWLSYEIKLSSIVPLDRVDSLLTDLMDRFHIITRDIQYIGFKNNMFTYIRLVVDEEFSDEFFKELFSKV